MEQAKITIKHVVEAYNLTEMEIRQVYSELLEEHLEKIMEGKHGNTSKAI